MAGSFCHSFGSRVNRKFCEISGYAATELLQMQVMDLTHPEDRERERELFRRVMLGETPNYHIEKRYLRKDGKQAWVSVNMAPTVPHRAAFSLAGNFQRGVKNFFGFDCVHLCFLILLNNQALA